MISTPGDPEVLQLQEVEDPVITDDEILIKVAAAALNRADTFHRNGLYELPSGHAPYLGMECSGTILALGKNVTRWKIGDQVFFYFKFCLGFFSLIWLWFVFPMVDC